MRSFRSKRSNWILVVVLAGLALSLAGCGQGNVYVGVGVVGPYGGYPYGAYPGYPYGGGVVIGMPVYP